MEVADLERGTRYTVILVATTGTEEKSLETDSDSEIIKTAGQRKWKFLFILNAPAPTPSSPRKLIFYSKPHLWPKASYIN
jgi:hypothetical protein